MTISAGDEGRPLLLASLLCLVGVAMFSIMDAVMKELALTIGAYSAVLYRGIIGTAVSGTAMIAGRARMPTRPVLWLHIRRGVVVSVMSWTFFWSLTLLPLAEAIALSFIAPIVALYLAALLLKEEVGKGAILAALLGLGGVALVLSGRISGQYQPDALVGALAVLFSAILFAYNLVLQRELAQQAKPLEMSFFQNSVMMLVFLPFAPFLATAPTGGQWVLVVLATALVLASQLSLGWAYARAPAARLIPLEYSAFIWAALLGWLVFEENLSAAVVAGAAVIVIACVLASRRHPPEMQRVEAEVA